MNFMNYEQDVTYLSKGIESNEIFIQDLKQIYVERNDNNEIQQFTTNFKFYQFTKLNELYISYDLNTVNEQLDKSSFLKEIKLPNIKNSEFLQKSFSYVINCISSIDVKLGNNKEYVTSDELNKQKIFRSAYMSYLNEEKPYGLGIQQNIYPRTYIDPNILQSQSKGTSPLLQIIQYPRKYEKRNFGIANPSNYYSKTYDNLLTNPPYINNDNDLISLYQKKNIIVRLADLDPFFNQDISLPNAINIEIFITFDVSTQENFISGFSQSDNSTYKDFYNSSLGPAITNVKIFGKKYWFDELTINNFNFYKPNLTVEDRINNNKIYLSYDSFKFYETKLYPNKVFYTQKIIWDYFLPDDLIIFIRAIKNDLSKINEDDPNAIITKITNIKTGGEQNCNIINLDDQPQNGFCIKKLTVKGIYNFEYENNDTEIINDNSIQYMFNISKLNNQNKNNLLNIYNTPYIKFPLIPKEKLVDRKIPEIRELEIDIEFDTSILFTKKNGKVTAFPISNDTYDYTLTFGLKYQTEGEINENSNIYKKITNY